MKKNIGILGGSFNPVHYGHLRMAETVLRCFPIEKCLMMPNFQNPMKAPDDSALAADRVEMLRLGIAGLSKDLGIEVSTFESDQNKICYTVETVKHFSSQGVHPLFIMGADSFRDFAGWKNYRDIFTYASVAVVTRGPHPDTSSLEQLIPITLKGLFEADRDDSFPFSKERDHLISLKHKDGNHLYFVPMPPVAISSSELRTRIRDGKDCTHFIPEPVLDFIYNKKIYAPNENRVKDSYAPVA